MACVLGSAVAAAHEADLIAVDPTPRPGGVDVAATMTAQTLALLAPVDADADGLLTQADVDASERAIRLGFWEQAPLWAGLAKCALESTRALVRQSDVLLVARYGPCQGEVSQDFRFLSVLPKNYSVQLLGSRVSGLKARTAQYPSTRLYYWGAGGTQRLAPPPPAWVWAVFLAGPCLLMLFERRRF